MINQPPSNAREIPIFEAVVNDFRPAADPCIFWLLDNRPGIRGIAADALLRYHMNGQEPKLSERPTDIQDFWRIWNLCNQVPGVFASLRKLTYTTLVGKYWASWVNDYAEHEKYIQNNPQKFPTP